MPSVTFKLFQASFFTQIGAIAVRALYGDIPGALMDLALVYIGVKALQEQSPALFWFYLIPSGLEGLSMLSAAVQLATITPKLHHIDNNTLSPEQLQWLLRWRDAIKDNPLLRLPMWVLVFTGAVSIISALLAAKLASRIYSRNLMPVDYMRPDQLGSLVTSNYTYTRGDSVSDLTRNVQPERIKFNAINLSSSSEGSNSPQSLPPEPATVV